MVLVLMSINLPTTCLQVSKTFKDKEFCIVNGLPTLPKNEMERKIAEVINSFICATNTVITLALCWCVDEFTNPNNSNNS